MNKLKLVEKMATWRERRILRRGLRSNQRGTTNISVSAEGVGYGLAVTGGIIAVVDAIAMVFVPTTSWSTLNAEYTAVAGAAFLIVGIVVHALSQ